MNIEGYLYTYIVLILIHSVQSFSVSKPYNYVIAYPTLNLPLMTSKVRMTLLMIIDQYLYMDVLVCILLLGGPTFFEWQRIQRIEFAIHDVIDDIITWEQDDSLRLRYWSKSTILISSIVSYFHVILVKCLGVKVINIYRIWRHWWRHNVTMSMAVKLIDQEV